MDSLAESFREIESRIARFNGVITTLSVYLGFDCDVNLEEARSLFEVRERRARGKKTYRSFCNSFSAVFAKKCAKIFRNGTQVTGCKHWKELADIIEAVCQRLKVTVVSSRIVMCNVMVKHYEPLELLKLAILRLDGIRVQYDRDDYPGMKIKCNYKERELTGLLFSSGSILLAGCKCADEIHALHNVIYKKILIYNK